MGFEKNKQGVIAILKGRICNFIYEGDDNQVFIKDEKQDNNSHQIIILNEKQDKYTFEIENTSQSMFAIFPMDGNNGTFNGYSPPVKDKELFTFNWIGNSNTKEVKTKNAGACDALLVEKQGLHFFESKAEAFEQLPFNTFDEYVQILANQHLDKAEKQLARTMTFFREQADEKKVDLDVSFYAIVVTLPTFPHVDAAFINRATRFFLQFEASLLKLNTDEKYII